MQPLRYKLWIVGTVYLFLVAQACAKKEEAKESKAAVTEAKPKIAIAEKQFNFGKVKQGQSVEHVFEIQNQGNADLIIEEARGSCGCLATVLSAKQIAPGGEGQIKATLDTSGRQGKLRKRIFVTSNDPVDRKLVLNMEGEVSADVTITPSHLFFGEVKSGEKVAKELSISVEEPQRVKITGVTVEDKRFAVRFKSGDAKGNAVYELQFKGEKKVEIISAELLVKYEGSNAPSRSVPIRAVIVSDLKYPRMIQLYRRDDKLLPVDISISSRSNKSFNIKRVEDPKGILKVDIVEGKGPKALLRAQLIDEKAAPLQPGTRYSLTVYTNNKDEPKIEIAYMVFHAPAPGAMRTAPQRPRPTSPLPPPAPAPK